MTPMIMNPFRFGSASAEYASMYESRSELTVIQKQHFVEWFSGSVLDSIWTEHSITGSGIFAMSDTIDGGFTVGVDNNNNQISWIAFNDKRQYEPTGSVFIAVVKRAGAVDTNEYRTGLRNFATTSSSFESAYAKNQKVAANISLVTGDASADTETASTVAVSTNYNSIKLELGSSNVKETIDGVLEVTKTTNRPTAKLQPFFGMLNGGTETVTSTGHIRYMECYNT